MWISWFVIGTLMICTNRWYTHLHDATGYLHAFFGWAILGCTAFAAIDLIANRGWHFKGKHHVLGFMVFFGLILFVITGIATFLSRKLLKRNTQTIIALRTIHRLLAFGFWAFSMATITTGMLYYKNNFATNTDDYKYFPWLSLGIMGFIVLTNESYFQWIKRKEDPFVTNKTLKNMKQEAFHDMVAKGQKLVILDNMVLDVASFVYKHPGGAYLLEYNLGGDISKFFYGSYALDGNSNDPKAKTQKHAHSNIARKTANRLAIGILSSRPYFSGDFHSAETRFTIDKTKTWDVNGFTKSFVFDSITNKRLAGV
jgi:cytochrome b involved in lipid metabolism